MRKLADFKTSEELVAYLRANPGAELKGWGVLRRAVYYIAHGLFFYRVRRRLFLYLMPKNLTVYMAEGLERTGIYDADARNQGGWGSINIQWWAMDVTDFGDGTCNATFYPVDAPKRSAPECNQHRET